MQRPRALWAYRQRSGRNRLWVQCDHSIRSAAYQNGERKDTRACAQYRLVGYTPNVGRRTRDESNRWDQVQAWSLCGERQRNNRAGTQAVAVISQTERNQHSQKNL
jgi:hypothetical protein